jgi:hypothetical protein
MRNLHATCGKSLKQPILLSSNLWFQEVKSVRTGAWRKRNINWLGEMANRAGRYGVRFRLVFDEEEIGFITYISERPPKTDPLC